MIKKKANSLGTHNSHVPKNRASQYAKQNLTELKKYINKTTVIVRDF